MSKKPGYKPLAASKIDTSPRIAVSTPEREWVLDYKYYLFLFLLAFALYSNTLNYGYTLDDPISTANNKYVSMGVDGIPMLLTKGYMYGLNGVNQGAYRPMPLITFAIEYELIGENPQVNHWVNVILYCLSVLLLFITLKRLLYKWHFFFAFAATVLYVAHPLHTEVVASIKSRDEILAMIFSVASLWFVLKYIDGRKILTLLWGFVMLLLAMLSKESPITFLAVIPFSVYFFRDVKIKELVIVTSPLLIAVVLYLGMRSAFLESVVSSKNLDVINNTLYAAENSAQKFATGFFILFKYIWLLFVPVNLSWDYSFNQIPIIELSDIKAVFSILVYLGLIVLSIWSLKRKHFAGYCAIFFLSTISVVSNLVVDFGSTMGERFLFVPSIAFCLFFVWMLYKIFKIDFYKPVLKTGAVSILSLVLILYSVKTYSRNDVWKNNMNLFVSGVKSAPNSARTNFCLGYEYFVYGDKETEQQAKDNYYKRAIVQMGEAVKIYPRYVDAHKNIGFMYYKLKDWDNAIVFLKQSMMFNDSLPDANFYTALCYGYKSSFDTAFHYFERALKLQPKYMEAYHYRGVVTSDYADKQSDLARRTELLYKALEDFEKARTIDSTFAETYIQKGYTYGKLNDFKKAIDELKKAVVFKPDAHEAILFTGIAYGFLKDYENALIHFRKALEVKPGYSEAYRNLAITYKTLGKYNDEIVVLEQALKVHPNDENFKALLAEAQTLKK